MGIYDKTSLKLKLTPNFALGEFVKPEHINELTPPEFTQLHLLAQRLQVVRDITGKAITVTSGWRPKTYNASIGGKKNSYHVKGMAADIVVNGMTPRALQKLLKDWTGGLGCYNTFTHVDTRGQKARW